MATAPARGPPLFTFKPAGKLPGLGSEENGTTVHTLDHTKAYLFDDQKTQQEEHIWALGLMMTGLIIVALLIELLTTHIEKTLQKKDKDGKTKEGNKELLRSVFQVYKGMMILGVLSLVLFIFKFTGAIEAMTGADDDTVFDYAFLLLSVSLLTYLLSVVGIIFFTVMILNQWRKYEEIDRAEAKKRFDELGGGGGSKGCYRYHLFRARFISNWDLRADFPFHRYLRRCGLRNCTDLASIHWTVWVALLVGVLINTIRMLVIDLEIFGGTITFIVWCWLTLGIGLIVAWKTNAIWDELMGSLPTPGSSDEKSLSNPEETQLLSSSAVAEKHKKLFWGGDPKSLTILIQVVLVLCAILLPLYFCHYIEWWISYPVGDAVLFHILTLAPLLFTLAVLIPFTLDKYTMARSVGYLTEVNLVNRIEMAHKVKVIEEEERHRREVAQQRRDLLHAEAAAAYEALNKQPSCADSVVTESTDHAKLVLNWSTVHNGAEGDVTQVVQDLHDPHEDDQLSQASVPVPKA